MADPNARTKGQIAVASFLPHIFVTLSATALILATVTFWRSLRGLLSSDNWSISVDAPGGFPGHRSVLFERQNLRQAIEDIRSERDMGRLSQSDFDALDRTLRDREKAIGRLLDTDEQSARELARKLIEEHLTRQIDGDEPKNKNQVETPRTCISCGVSNDSDARYCKSCGKELDEEVEL